MTNPMEPAFGYEKDNFDKTCDYCGCVFNVAVPGQGYRGVSQLDINTYRLPLAILKRHFFMSAETRH